MQGNTIKLGFHGATSMHADLQTDVAAAAPLNDICARLKGIGYHGPCSIELFRPEYWDWDPMQLAVKTREAAINVLSPYFEIE